ncbi:MAG TPA: FG-GAP repeat protein, partial [Myxococcota bacterium]|nr:FG-GAP repeat protein [Myxococcota bacterium]
MAFLLLLTACGSSTSFLTLSGPNGEATLGDEGLSWTTEEGDQSPSLQFRGWYADQSWQDFRPEALDEVRCPADLPLQAACVRRGERRSAEVVEWAVLRDQGLQQGWTLADPGRRTRVVELRVGVEGRQARLDGGVVWLEADDGSTWNYAGLQAWDARGEDLPAHLDLQQGELLLRVETDGASWPITVDPVLSTASVTLTGSASSSFGYAMSTADVNGDGYDDAI